MMEPNGSEADKNRFIYLLNIPILRQQILQYLPLKCILNLRGVSHEIKSLIDEIYLPFELTIIDVGRIISPTYPISHFPENVKKGLEILLIQTRSLRSLHITCSYSWLTDGLLLDILKSNSYLTELKFDDFFEFALSPRALHSILDYGINVRVLKFNKFNSRSMEFIESEEIKLEELDISLCDNSYTYLGELLQKCENLRVLRLRSSTCKDSIVVETLRNCRNLRMLSFYYWSSSMTEAFSGLSSSDGCKNIESLTLANCDSITNESLKALSNFMNLKMLVLESCPSVKLEAISDIILCERLQMLSLNLNWRLSDRALQGISHRNLRKLYLSFCHSVTSTGISDLINGCPALEEVFLSGCQNHKRECFRVGEVVIHINGKIPPNRYDDMYIFDEYCKAHRLKMYL